MNQNIYEVVPARNYYGRHATGSVVLKNGYPVYHATSRNAKSEAKSFVKTLTKSSEYSGSSLPDNALESK